MILRPRRHPDRALLGTMLLAAGLLLAQGPAHGRNPNLELDEVSDARLDQLLQDELDWDDLAACGLEDPSAAKTKDEMFEIILCALGDDSDQDEENDLNFDDLQEEMKEADTTVEEVVRRALDIADEIATAPEAPRLWLAAAGAVCDVTPFAAQTQPPAAQLLALKDDSINPGSAAIRPVKSAIAREVTKRKS